MNRELVNKVFDPVLKAATRFNKYKGILISRLEKEAILHQNLPPATHPLLRLSNLLQINHQRVTGSISHISLMIAVLMISFQYILATGKSLNVSQEIVACEIILYLLMAVALLRCLRDFGLDKDDYYTDENSYYVPFIEEIALRYHVISICNFIIISATVLFVIVLGRHFLIMSIWPAVSIGLEVPPS